jgi:hypothetical protein
MAATPASNSAASTSTISFPAVEEDILLKWKNENTFATQNKLSQERGDKVRPRMRVSGTVHNGVSVSCGDSDLLLSAPMARSLRFMMVPPLLPVCLTTVTFWPGRSKTS